MSWSGNSKKVTIDAVNPSGHGLYLRVLLGIFALEKESEFSSLFFSVKLFAQQSKAEGITAHRLQTWGENRVIYIKGVSTFLTSGPIKGFVPGFPPLPPRPELLTLCAV